MLHFGVHPHLDVHIVDVNWLLFWGGICVVSILGPPFLCTFTGAAVLDARLALWDASGEELTPKLVT